MYNDNPTVFRQYRNVSNGLRMFLQPHIFESVSQRDPDRYADMPEDVDNNGQRQEYYYENNKHVKKQESIRERAKAGVQIGNTAAFFPPVDSYTTPQTQPAQAVPEKVTAKQR